MALKKAAVRPADDLNTADVPEVPDSIPRGSGGRPKIRELVQGDDGVWSESNVRFVTYTRASTLSKVLESDYAIQESKRRKIVFGMSRSPELVLKAAALRTVTEDEDKKELGGIAEAALEVAKAGAAAIRGTAIHKLSERHDAGENLSYLPSYVLEALSVYRQFMSQLRIIASETFVVCDDLLAAGTFDRVVELLHDTEVRYLGADGSEQVDVLVAGTRLVLDLKTNKTADYFGPTYCSQQAVYGYSVPYTANRGRGEWPDGVAPSTAWALILHIPIDSLADAGFHWVDLKLGYQLGELANTMREQAKRKDLFWPADLKADAELLPPDVDTPLIESEPNFTAANIENLLTSILEAPDEDALGKLWDDHQNIWIHEHTEAVKLRFTVLAAARDAAVPAPREPDVEPVQVRRLKLIRELQMAQGDDVINALWEAHQDIWDTNCTAMVKARLRQLAAEVSA